VAVRQAGRTLLESICTIEAKGQVTPADYVNQFTGTSGSRWMIAPGPWMPMGMVKIAPDNEDGKWKAGYDYQVENCMGFSHVHEWTMAGLLMMPSNGPLMIHPGPETQPDLGYRSRIDKTTETAKVGYYSVDLLDYGIKAELTSTTRASFQRYTFNQGGASRILIDLLFPAEYAWVLKDFEVTRVSEYEIEGVAVSHCSSTGYAGEQDYQLYFVIQMDKAFTSMDGWVNDVLLTSVDKLNGQSDWGEFAHRHKKREFVGDAGIILNLETYPGETVQLRTGISLVSAENARLNLQSEVIEPFDWDFEAVVANQKSVWNKLLGRVEIETDDYLLKEKFYTNMYRALCPRNTWSDVNGQWRDMNEDIQQLDNPERVMYGSDGYWGWHWNLVPFYNLVVPEIASNWIHTFLETYDKGGWLPIGNPGMEYFRVMVGQPAIPLMVSAYQHGIRDFDTDKMLEALNHQQNSLMQNHPGGGEVGNESYNHYLKKGYVPLNSDHQSYVSNTMEYAYQDWCFAQYAQALKKDSIYKALMKRSENWRHIFDKEVGFVRPRKKDGSWLEPFDPYRAPGFCESNAWQYTWYVPHNVSDLVDAMGRERFIQRLDKGMQESEKVFFNALGDDFTRYPINHGNESNMQSCYLFNYTGQPWRTQKWARAIQEKYYGAGPRDGYPGDEDQGQMSAWYVMSTMGLFQMEGGCSINPYYELGSPRFKKVTIHLNNDYYTGKAFVIEAKDVSLENKYIQAAYLNGEELQKPWFYQSELKKGGCLKLIMGPEPNKEWGVGLENCPPQNEMIGTKPWVILCN
jgi:predicted alpha-1,2-mannosidase